MVTTATSGASHQTLGRDYWVLAASSAVSNLADGVFKIALPLLVVRVTSSPAAVAGVEVVRSLPWALFALPAGALVDRFNRVSTMVIASVVRATAVLGAAVSVAVSPDSVGWLIVAAGVTGIAEVFYDTAAQTALPNIVPAEALPRANGRLMAAELGAQQFLGPPLAGALLAISLAASLFIPSALWMAAALSLLLLRGRFGPRTAGTRSTVRTDVADGLRFVRDHPILRRLAAMVGVSNLLTSAAFVLLVLYAAGPDSTLGLSAAQYGTLLVTIAIGGVVGSVTVDRLIRRLGRHRVLSLSIVGVAAFLLAPAAHAPAPVLAATMFVGGFSMIAWNIPTVSFRQTVTPDHMLGRVNSVYRLTAWGSLPIGAALGGLLGELFGIHAVFALAGICHLLLVVPNRAVSDHHLDQAERGCSPNPGETEGSAQRQHPGPR